MCHWFLLQSLMLAEELVVLSPFNRPHLHNTGTEGRTGLDADVASGPQEMPPVGGCSIALNALFWC